MNVHSKIASQNTSPKREQILAAALRLVSQHGFHGTSMSMLAEEAGCGAGTIYNYFSGKDALMQALFRTLKAQFMVTILAGDNDQESLQERFMRFWKNAIHYFLNYPDNAAFFQQYHSSPYYNDESQAFTEAAIQPLVSIIEQAMQAGTLRMLPQPVLESLTVDLATSLARRHIQGEIILDESLIEETGLACWQSLQVNDKK